MDSLHHPQITDDVSQYVNANVYKNKIPKTVETFMIATELKAKGYDITDLSVGEPDFATPQVIREAAKRAIDEGKTRYTPDTGAKETKIAVCNYLNEKHGMQLEFKQVSITSGAKQGVYASIMTSCLPGDYIIIPSPAWPSYFEIPRMNGINIIEVKTSIDNDFLMTQAQLEQVLAENAAILDKIKLIILCYPSNPTGSIYSYDQLVGIASVLLKHPQIFVLSDEIYEDLNYGVVKHTPFIQVPGMAHRTFAVSGFSKNFAMTGFRIGYVVTSLQLSNFINKPISHTTGCSSNVSQMAAIEACNNKEAHLESRAMVKTYKERSDAVFKELLKIPEFTVKQPHGAFYFFINITKLIEKRTPEYLDKNNNLVSVVIKDSTDFTDYLLYTQHVAVVPGNDFGSNDCFRITFSKDLSLLLKGIRLIKLAVDNLITIE